jgi:hypothetical protein
MACDMMSTGSSDTVVPLTSVKYRHHPGTADKSESFEELFSHMSLVVYVLEWLDGYS